MSPGPPEAQGTLTVPGGPGNLAALVTRGNIGKKNILGDFPIVKKIGVKFAKKPT